jgi:prophage antirepressor-like protein
MKGKINMENKLITVSGVTGYIDENGTAQLNLENVARGLGFTDNSKGVEYVRWARVDDYLEEFKFATSGERAEFIPENIFYRLAMKASNKTAIDFQCKIADEILPSIRKHGAYSVHPMTQLEMIAAQAAAMVEVERTAKTALEIANKASQQITNALDVFTTPPDKDWRQGMNDRIRGVCQEYGLSYLVFYGDLYKELEDTARVDLQARLTRLRTRLSSKGMTKTACKEATKLEVVERDVKLRPIFEGIVRKYQSRYATDKINAIPVRMV